MVDSEFNVLLWPKALVLDLDQAEQHGFFIVHPEQYMKRMIIVINHCVQLIRFWF